MRSQNDKIKYYILYDTKIFSIDHYSCVYFYPLTSHEFRIARQPASCSLSKQVFLKYSMNRRFILIVSTYNLNTTSQLHSKHINFEIKYNVSQLKVIK